MKARNPLAYMMQTVVDYVSEDVLEEIQCADRKLKGDTDINAINFEYGSHEEIREKLKRKDGDEEGKHLKYPCIIMPMDLVEPTGLGTQYEYGKPRITLGIIHHTEHDMEADERYEKVIVPILYPIYKSLIENILASGLFIAYDIADIPHNRIDRVNMGKQGFLQLDDVSYDYVDGIELNNLELTIAEPYACS